MKRAKKRTMTLWQRASGFALRGGAHGNRYEGLLEGFIAGYRAAQRASRKSKSARSKK